MATEPSLYKATVADNSGDAPRKSHVKDAVALTTFDAYTRARDAGHDDWVREARRFDNFYLGEQWSEADRKELESAGRPALTINKILPTVNVVLGEQSSKRADLYFKPRKNGTEDTAAVLTKLAMHVLDANDFEYRESMLFADGLIQDRGYLDIRISQDRNIQGEIAVTLEDPLDIIPDPDARDYDPATWKEFFKESVMSLDDIADMYGEAKAEELKGALSDLTSWSQDIIQMKPAAFGDTRHAGTPLAGPNGQQRFFRSIRVVERQYRKRARGHCFVDPRTGDEKMAPPSWDAERRTQFAAQFGLLVYPKIVERVRWTVVAGHLTTLHDDWSPYRTFTIVPFFPYFRRGRPFGMVRNLISPQEQLNKLESQILHVVNTTANSGWIVEEGVLNGMTTDDLRRYGSKTGVVVTVNPGRKDGLEKIQPNQIPTGLENVSQKSAAHIKEISNVNDPMLGQGNSEMSGVVLDNLQARGALSIQKPLDHLAFTRLLLGRKVLELLQQFYTEERVFHIVDERSANKDSEEMVINQIDAIGNVINDITVGDYEVTISTMPARGSFDESQFAQAVSLREAGVLIPDDAVVEYSNLHKRAELAARIRELQGTAPPSPEQVELSQAQQQILLQMQMAELEKLRSEVAQLQSAAQLNLAKAQQAADAGEVALSETEADVQKKREELGARIDLAHIAAESKERIAAQKGALQLSSEHTRQQHDIDKTVLSEVIKLRGESREQDRPNPTPE